MSRKYTIEAVVEGSAEFPMDMLRYDTCFPATEPDAYTCGKEGKRQVRVRQYSDTPRGRFTEGRWKSFGWTILSTSKVY